ncbi:aliphatic nitrilase, partial [Klebsiella pneumoniae]|nr:aliphatic nitrilase [Klebsiella pneumoniae]
MAESRIIRAAAAQIAPDLHEASRTLARVLEAIDEAAEQGAEIIVFPETFVPYYP